MRRRSDCEPAYRAAPVSTHEPGGTVGSRAIGYGQAVFEALAGELARDPRVVFLGPDEPARPSGLVASLSARFGDQRVWRVAGAGPGLLAEALAASSRGLRPCVEIPFVAPCCSSWAGALRRGPEGRLPPLLMLHTLTGVEPFCVRPLCLAFPEVRVVAASDPLAAQGLVRAGLRGEESILCLTHYALLETLGEVPEGEYVLSPAEARLLRQGRDVTLVVHHLSLGHGLAAAGELAEAGVSVEVLDPVSLWPLDEGTLLASVRKTGRVVVVEETEAAAGLGAEIAATVCEKAFFDLDAPVKRLGARWNHWRGREVAGAPAGTMDIREAIASIL